MHITNYVVCYGPFLAKDRKLFILLAAELLVWPEMIKEEENDAEICFKMKKEVIARLNEISEKLRTSASEIISRMVLDPNTTEIFKDKADDNPQNQTKN